jgi:hypothetical protein
LERLPEGWWGELFAFGDREVVGATFCNYGIDDLRKPTMNDSVFTSPTSSPPSKSVIVAS